jgi:type I restriction enzyme S subunit
MELKQGYSQTKAGGTPEGWETKRLRDVAQIRSGIAKNANVSVSDPVLVYYLRVANVQDGYLDLSEMSKLEVSRGDLQRFSVLPGDVLMNEGGDRDKLGRGSIWRGELQPCVHQNHVFVVRCSSDIVPEYLTTWSAGSMARKYFLVAGNQTTNLASINKTSLGNLPVLLPPKQEQRAIAEVLSDVDNLLGKLDELIAKKRDLKQAAMQQLLTGQTRLPGFNGSWKDGVLADVIDALEAGVSVNSAEDGGASGHDGMYILKTSAIARGRFIPQECKRIAPRDIARARLNPKMNTVLVSRMNTPDLVGECGFVDRDYPYLFVPDRLWMTRFKSNSNTNGLWLSYILSTPLLKQRIRAAATGTSGSMKNLSKQSFLQIPVTYPSGPEQDAIAIVLSEMDNELAALESRRDKTHALKQAMMQELLTGKTRLVTPEVAHA